MFLKKNIFKQCVSFALIAIILGYSSLITVSAAVYSVSVTRVKQKDTEWCWAACAEMVAHTVYPNSFRNQIDAVDWVHTAVVNKGANISQTAAATAYVGHSKFTAGGSSSPLSLDTVKTKLSQGKPIIASVQTGIGSRHMFVLYLYREATANSSDSVALIDPWENNTVFEYNYAPLINGGVYMSTWGNNCKWVASVDVS